MKSNIHYFFHPKSVAIIGASDKYYSWGNMIAVNLLGSKSQENVYLINPKHDRVLGEKAYGKIAEVPEDIDLAIVIVPAPKVVPTLEECAAKNVKVATIISAGFSETSEGKQLGDDLKRFVEEYQIRLQGPNCAGYYNASVPINASPLPPRFLIESPVAFITQSGFVGNTLSVWGPTRNLTLGKYISVGNEADLTVTDYVEYFGQDPTVQVMLLYIEGIKDGTRFSNVMREVTPKKQVVVWKTSETSAVKRAALSHTAHLVGSQQVFQGLRKQLGIIQVQRLEYGLIASHAFLRHPPLRGNRFAITMVGAGWAIILTDALSTAGFSVPEFSQDLQDEIRRVLPNYRASVKNPVDFGAADTMDFSLMMRIIRKIFESGEIDGFIVANIGEFSSFEDEGGIIEVQIAKSLNRIQKKYQKPIYIFTLMTEADSKSIPLIKKKMNMYHSIDELLEVLKAQLFYYRWKERIK
ncbi:MAG: CoA-binding protein [Candidatus Helarchaeota archaeon]|nr:CoA-binding protein [Candidatus Helarchaeota archaeon]